MIKQVEDYLELLKSGKIGNKREIKLKDYLEKTASLSMLDLEVTTEEDMYNLLLALGVVEEVSIIAYGGVHDCKVVHAKSLNNYILADSQSKYYFRDFKEDLVIPIEDCKKVFMVF